ncbi:hypothetical protein RJ640_018194 [Escallonia rubra]|uniref:DOG1 domain-containing protein n=1 Tax=Escallonia rubra TaxID=112253 RepID=A0AA88UJG7_9ASTE|nr:hypothetical protein RJ640_018194 [Escallonia rubra]
MRLNLTTMPMHVLLQVREATSVKVKAMSWEIEGFGMKTLRCLIICAKMYVLKLLDFVENSIRQPSLTGSCPWKIPSVAYVQQLESSRMKLTQLEQELQRARQQGIFISSTGDQAQSMSGNGALAFDVEYARWLEEHIQRINELRGAVNSHAGDGELRIIVDGVLAHYDDIFRIKGDAAKADVFHILSGMWKTPAERKMGTGDKIRRRQLLVSLSLSFSFFKLSAYLFRFFLLHFISIVLNGIFRFQLLINQLEPLTEQQLLAISNLQQSSQQAEDALSQGMEALQQSLAETLAGSLGPSSSSGNVANYMGQMAMAMGKLGTLEGFIRQADNLRQQTLQQMHRILTTRQSARALLAINDYFSRLRALSALWLARPRD